MRTPITPEPIMRMANGLWFSQTLSAAVELELFTKIAKGINTVKAMAASLATDRRPIEALLNACVALELLAKDDQVYRNTELSDTFLVQGRPNYCGDSVIMLTSPLG